VEAWPLLIRLWRLQRALNEEASPCMAEHGLSPRELMLLAFIEYRPHAGQLARELHLPAPSVTHSLKRLEKAGLITRKSDPGDLRRFVFRLTDEGRRALDAGRDCLIERMRERLGCLSPEERTQLIGFLDRMLEGRR